MRSRLAAAGLLLLCLVVAVPCRAQPGKDLVPDLLKIIKDKFANDDKTRFKALETLVDLGPAAKSAVPELVKIAGDGFTYDEKFRMKALDGLARIGPDGKSAVPDVWKIVKNGFNNPEPVRIKALVTVGRMGIEGKEAAPELIKIAKDSFNSTEKFRLTALEATGSLGADAAGVVPDLIKMLDDTFTYNDALRAGIAKALGDIGAPAKGAIPSLIKATSGSAELAKAANLAMDKINRPPAPPVAREVVPYLDALKSKDESVRLGAVKSLGKLGVMARDALPALREAAAKDADADVRRIAGEAVKLIESSTSVPDQIAQFIRDLKSDDESIRLRAAKALGKFGAAAKSAAQALTEALKDSDADVRRVAAESLTKIVSAK